ncbi:Uncharacterised protein [Staphylococcus microti]|uniref:Uncharacterized protein n=1 Tax=Staphylococcus microti TaxID=569857 RepID=A0A380GT16_9STAP|nr:hypothetical protein [Staphylococcus microti]PNZ84620.1 hypothetical protein CD132_00270 [Staphylococcus microti]SUM56894.1 Uncharacterised protein [Staphylococcus microti]
MRNKIDDNNYIALICEGECEKYIVDKLLDENLLFFKREQLIDEKVLGGEFRNANKFTQKYLTLKYENKITIILVVDKHYQLKIKKMFSRNIDKQICVITRPEIEMLMILAMDKYKDYQKVKSSQKPSSFMNHLTKQNVKTIKFVENFYNEHNLVDAIKQYHHIRPDKSQYSLYNLLKH